MVEIAVTDDWKAAHAGAIIGILQVSGVDNAVAWAELDRRKRLVEATVRERFRGYARADFLAAPVLNDYERYYKRFDKSYHVQLQLESIVVKNKSLPNVSPLVDANFVAEIETLILTAGHDVAKLRGRLTIDVSKVGDVITQMNGVTKEMRPADMVMRDELGVSCSIIYGQDNRSPISRETQEALYVAYAPPGIEAITVEAQLSGILDNIKTFAPTCVVVRQELLQA